MPVVDVFNIAGEKVNEIQLDESVFGCEVKPHLLHDVVVWQMANRRAATAKTKSRSEVSGGGKKPWRQKGTGRARAGTNRSPSGGTAAWSSVPTAGTTRSISPRR